MINESVMFVLLFVTAMFMPVNAQLAIDCTDFPEEEVLDFATFIENLPNKELITSFTCENLSIKGSIPESISQLPNLEELSLANNAFEGDLPDSFADLVSLQTIDFSQNCLTGDLLGLTTDMNDLSEINVDRNKFDGTLNLLPESLTVFTATFNDFDNAFPSTIDLIVNLTTFNVVGNRLSGSIPDFLADLPLENFFIANNDLVGTVPEHSATETDAPPNSSPKRATLADKWRKYTLDSKCPERYTFAFEKIFSVSLIYTIPILGGLLVLCLGCCLCVCCCCCKRKEKNGLYNRLLSVTSMYGAASTIYGNDHYKIDVYMCESKNLGDDEENLKKILRSKLKQHQVRPTLHSKSGKQLDENAMLDSAAVIVLFSQDYLNEMVDEDSRAFAEIRAADGAGQWLIFACLERKLFIRGQTQKFLNCDYHMFDISSDDAIEENFESIMVNLFEAQAEKEVLMNGM